jgi:putative ABC transport system permease protein
MGAGRLIIGLAWRNLRHRPWQALLLLFALSMSTTAITVALALTEIGDRAWHRAAQATGDFHVGASTEVPQEVSERDRVRAELASLGSAPGVVAASAPWRQVQVGGEINGTETLLYVEVRDPEPAAVDQPLVTAGQWLDNRQGVVVEEGLAAAADLDPGDTITIAGQHLPIRGAALSVSAQPYPMHQPARVWISPAAATRLAGALDGGAYVIALRLSDPDQAESFAAAHPEVSATWQEEKSEFAWEIQELTATLAGLAAIVVGLTIATAALLVAGRMATQIRQVGTLKAVGVTPGQVTRVLLVEYLTVALVATAVGLAAGTLLAPSLARLTRVLSVYGAQSPPITLPRAAIVVAIATTVVLLATVRPALRGVRRSTLHSLNSTARPPHQPGPLIRALARLPLPLPIGLGLRAATRRPGRFIATTFGLTIGIALVIAALALRTGVQAFHRESTSRIAVDAHDGDPFSLATELQDLDRASTLGFTIATFLIGLAVINAVIAAVFSANDSARNHAILRTLGTTPRQTVTAFLIAHLTACLLACALGIPLGIAIYNAIRGGSLGPIELTPLTYFATSLTALLLYTLIALTPAKLLTRRPITPLLAYE